MQQRQAVLRPKRHDGHFSARFSEPPKTDQNSSVVRQTHASTSKRFNRTRRSKAACGGLVPCPLGWVRARGPRMSCGRSSRLLVWPRWWSAEQVLRWPPARYQERRFRLLRAPRACRRRVRRRERMSPEITQVPAPRTAPCRSMSTQTRRDHPSRSIRKTRTWVRPVSVSTVCRLFPTTCRLLMGSRRCRTRCRLSLAMRPRRALPELRLDCRMSQPRSWETRMRPPRPTAQARPPAVPVSPPAPRSR